MNLLKRGMFQKLLVLASAAVIVAGFSCFLKTDYKKAGTKLLEENDYKGAYLSFLKIEDEIEKTAMMKSLNENGAKYYGTQIDTMIDQGKYEESLDLLAKVDNDFDGELALDNKVVDKAKSKAKSLLDDSIKVSIPLGNIDEVMSLYKKYTHTFRTPPYGKKEIINKVFSSFYGGGYGKIKAEELLRNEEKFIGELITLNGDVFQELESKVAIMTHLPFNLDGFSSAMLDYYKELFYELTYQLGDETNNIWANYDGSKLKILEKDFVALYGKYKGVKSYETSLGDEASAMEIDAIYWLTVGKSGMTTSIDKEVDNILKTIPAKKISANAAVISSSSLPNDQYGSYEPKNILDKNLKTSWVEGKKDAGVGEWILIKTNKSVGTLKFANGYQEKESSYYANNRVKSAKVLLITEPMIASTNISEIAEQIDDLLSNDMISWEMVDIQDKTGYQEIKLANKGACKYLVFQIADVYKGTKYNDTCIAEIETIE